MIDQILANLFAVLIHGAFIPTDLSDPLNFILDFPDEKAVMLYFFMKE